MNWHIVHAKSTCLTFSAKNWQIQLFSTPTLKAYHYADKRAVNLLKTTKNRHFERHHNVAEIHSKTISKLSHIYDLAGVFYNAYCYFTRLNLKKMGSLYFCLPALLETHRNPKQKLFEILWGINEGRTIRARSSWPFLKNSKNGIFVSVYRIW